MPVPIIGTPFVSSAFSRVSSVLSQNVIMGNLRASQEELLRIQEQLATGLRILRPSDDAIGANRILEYNIQINRNEQFTMNITTANGRVNGVITEREPPDGYLVFQGGLPEIEDFLRGRLT